MGIRWENTAPGTESPPRNFCAGISLLQLGVVLVSFRFVVKEPEKILNKLIYYFFINLIFVTGLGVGSRYNTSKYLYSDAVELITSCLWPSNPKRWENPPNNKDINERYVFTQKK